MLKSYDIVSLWKLESIHTLQRTKSQFIEDSVQNTDSFTNETPPLYANRWNVCYIIC